MRPLRLPPHQLHRFYSGGEAIAALRGLPSTDDHAPEDWVGSTTTLFGEDRLGLSELDDGRLLRDAIAVDPEGFLGPEHVARHGADPALLVKLLDAGQRLPVHAHPDRAWARRHLDCPYGKTEAWIVVGTRGPDPRVHLGFQQDVAAETLAGWVRDQAVETLLAALHSLPVRPGDALLVPAGLPHAIGEGVFIVELQEPTDLSVLLDWQGFEVDGTADGHLGLGFDVALSCVDRSGWGRDALDALRTHRDTGPLLPPAADAFFRAERLRAPAGELTAGFAVLVVLAGDGQLETETGGVMPLHHGDTVLVPHAAGRTRLIGDLEVVRARPPDAGGEPVS